MIFAFFHCIKTTLIIRLVSAVAILGLLLVFTSFFAPLEEDQVKMLSVAGFTMMLLGTLWRVVLEMNSEDE